MLPKKIHYCRYGPKKPELVKRCIASWKSFCPDYEFIEWNETNCDFAINRWVKGAVKAKKRAFVADYFRLKALYDFGGIYIDADTEVVKNIDPVLNNIGGFLGFDDRKTIGMGFIGFEKGNEFIKGIIDCYDQENFKIKTINNIVSDILIKKGLIPNGKEQHINNIKIYTANKISIDMGDGEAFVVDYHMNSWENGVITHNKSRVYLEYLASINPEFSEHFDNYIVDLKNTYSWKIGSRITSTIYKTGLEKIYFKIRKIFS